MAKLSVQDHHAPRPDGVRVHYVEFSPGQRPIGEVLFVHGLASSGNQFASEAARLAAEGYRVIVPDLRGHGSSGVPDEPFSHDDFSIPTLTDDLLAVLDHASAGPVHWVGNSLGGILALSLMGTEMESRIATFVQFGTCMSLDLPPVTAFTFRLAFLPGKGLTGALTAFNTTSSPEGRRVIRKAIRQLNVEAGARIAHHVRRYDFLEKAKGFVRPHLVVWADGDRFVNLRLRKDLQRMGGRVNLTKVDLARAGHCANFDAPDEFCDVLQRFWKGSPVRL